VAGEPVVTAWTAGPSAEVKSRLVVTPRHIAVLELHGGHLALDFANTLEGPRDGHGEDLLRAPVDVAAWARRAGAIDEVAAARLGVHAARHPRRAAAALTRARTLRGVVHGTFAPIAAGEGPDPDALARLHHAHLEALTHGRLEPSRGAAAPAFAWRWDSDADLDRALWPVIVAAVDLLRSGDLARLKACPDCRLLFLDQSRNHSRRWCSMAGCGSRAKMRRYRSRRPPRRREPA
jgi:predicted RNA-binding Zn ribbon-like protein